MPNRHDRRAAEAETRKSFENYEALYRKAFKHSDARQIGEGFMRGAAAEAEGIDSMILHRPGEPVPPREVCEVELSAAYGKQSFRAFARRADLATLESEWLKLWHAVRALPGSPVTGEPRHDARAFIFEMVVTNQQYETGEFAAMTGSAIIWLARTSPVGNAVGHSHNRVHYEITDIKSGQRNYRLMLNY